MDDQYGHIKDWVFKFVAGKLSEKEKGELESWKAESEGNRLWFDEMTSLDRIAANMRYFREADEVKEEVRERLFGSRDKIEIIEGQMADPNEAKKGLVKRLRVWLPAAAVVAGLLIGVAIFLWIRGRDTHGREELAPGGLAAVLTLPDGRQFKLDSLAKGVLAVEGTVNVENAKSGELSYIETGSGKSDGGVNTLTTPKGGQYKLVLSDRTSVWLNAATTVRFANSLGSGARTVELESGEAYFEVAPASGQAFAVRVSAAAAGDACTIQALGTNFNVNAYTDEPEIRATLLSGIVRVIRGKDTAMLRPLERARIGQGAAGIVVDTTANAGATIAWKDGLFQFDGVGSEEVLRQLARWYNGEVVYSGVVKRGEFFGTFKRDMPISNVLLLLGTQHIHARTEGRKIIIIP